MNSLQNPAEISAEEHILRFARMSPEEIRACERDTLRRVADLALIPPRINTQPLPEFDYDQLDYGMTLGIERSPKGRLWVAWIAGDDGPRAFALVANSDDGGETWSKPCLVINSQSRAMPVPRSVIVGNLWTDPLGRLWFFFDQVMNHFDGRGGLWAIRCDNPDDTNPVWSEPRRIWHGSVLNKPLVLSTGEWMLPLQLLPIHGYGPFNEKEDLFPELTAYRGVNFFVSSDQGESWQRRGHLVLPPADWLEPMVVERHDGSLWMLGRTHAGVVESTSSDRGATWSEATYPQRIQHPAARFFLRRLSSGHLLLIKHGDRIDAVPKGGRVMLSAWLSEDDGLSWRGGLVLDERSGLSYPDGFEAPDGLIHISYDLNRSTEGRILLARFREEDVLAGKPVSGQVVLKHCMVRPLKNG